MGREHGPLRVAPGGRRDPDQKDVRQVQLAKAAIRAGLDALLARQRCAHRMWGACWLRFFGYHLRPDSLAGSGLLPAPLAAKVEAVGNTCKAGAVTLLSNAGTRRELQAVAGRVRSIELANDAAFGRRFVEQMAFGDAEHDQSRKKKPHEIPSQKACAHVH